ncbi:hypothetical protein K432DRAFT_470151 [Lepidopterella palustris CBS 459.81]|uniref:Uncharacterized protein n=1 Tax=Lepidopterella palustris CBS 459.81 TaxID=1314670 RepID=A0A8E2EF92_9PEZI|nr:hypothetical protein K432DRAFT_470151 [Lepidopterella palustris CBS 459.81]
MPCPYKSQHSPYDSLEPHSLTGYRDLPLTKRPAQLAKIGPRTLPEIIALNRSREADREHKKTQAAAAIQKAEEVHFRSRKQQLRRTKEDAITMERKEGWKEKRRVLDEKREDMVREAFEKGLLIPGRGRKHGYADVDKDEVVIGFEKKWGD